MSDSRQVARCSRVSAQAGGSGLRPGGWGAPARLLGASTEHWSSGDRSRSWIAVCRKPTSRAASRVAKQGDWPSGWTKLKSLFVCDWMFHWWIEYVIGMSDFIMSKRTLRNYSEFKDVAYCLYCYLFFNSASLKNLRVLSLHSKVTWIGRKLRIL
jgi:hypothetical protein